jgi:hypothetical protein
MRESESSEKNVASGDADKAGGETQDGESVHRAVDNILPRALSELDVKRLTWAVGRVRELMAAMLQRGEVVWELSPGIKVLSDLPGVGGNSTHTGDSSGFLSAWVRAFSCRYDFVTMLSGYNVRRSCTAGAGERILPGKLGGQRWHGCDQGNRPRACPQ